jgi:multidrug transporter EmrE-like cation transporter
MGTVGRFIAPSAKSMPSIATSSVVQTAYLIFLTATYKHGEFGQVYPLARGLSVLVVASFSTVVLGEILTPSQNLGLAVTVGALLSLVMLKGNGFAAPRNRKRVIFMCLTGLTIATYTLIDGMGVRLEVSSLGYAMCSLSSRASCCR